MNSRTIYRARAVALALLLAAPAMARAAEPVTAHWQLTPYAGYAFFIDPVYESRLGAVRLEDAPHYGGALGYQFNRGFGLQAGAGYTPTQLKRLGDDVSYLHAAGDLLWSPLRGPGWDLYGVLGLGFARFSVKNSSSREFGTFDAGAGARLWLTEHFALRAEGRNVLLLARNAPLKASKDNDALVTAGLTWALGGPPKDSDDDGVPDKRDACASTPAGARVDARGCPVDSDGDGVYDGLDQCADTPKGATVDASGCPHDADGDGVLDGLDQCADTPKGATVDANGCPTDTDGDGVLDGLDKCPNTPAGARVDKDGCPIVVNEKETELLDSGMIRLENVNFETGKADVLPESYPVLDEVGKVLGKWPELKIEIGGHTDARGSDELNRRLSQDRANAVQAYLLSHFFTLKAEQFTAVGYGESKPLVPNTNALNMAKNRRVEFVVLNKETLRREVEKRKMLEK